MIEFHKVAELDDLGDGRVRTVVVGTRTFALTRVGDRYDVLSNHCHHQGGPLGEGSIEKGLLRCPTHGYDYDPLTGTPPSEFSDAPACFPVDVRPDGVYVGLEPEPEPVRTVSDVMSTRWSRGGSPTCSGWSGTRTWGSPTPSAARRKPATSRSSGSATRVRPRSQRRPTASSPVDRRRFSPSPDPAAPTSSPASTTPRSTARRCLLCRGRSRRRCSDAVPSKTSTSPSRSPTSRATRRPCSRSRTTPSS